MSTFSWTCPFCNQPTTVTSNDIDSGGTVLSTENKEGLRKAIITFVVCPNTECKKFTLTLRLYKTHYESGWQTGDKVNDWRLIPFSDV